MKGEFRNALVGYALLNAFTQLIALPVGLNKFALLSMCIQWVSFLFSYALKTERFYDAVGSMTFLILTLYGFTAHGAGISWHDNWRQLIATGMVCAWALRLGTFLFLRTHAAGGRDSRFDGVRDNWISFLTFWTVQGVWVFATPLAVLMLQQEPPVKAPAYTDALGAAVFVLGWSIEVAADVQKSRWRKQRANSDKFINEGLWRCSRHPNYVGEMVLWLGIWLFCLAGISAHSAFRGAYSFVAPLFVFLLLWTVSTPLVERQADARFMHLDSYKQYKRQVPCLVWKL